MLWERGRRSSCGSRSDTVTLSPPALAQQREAFLQELCGTGAEEQRVLAAAAPSVPAHLLTTAAGPPGTATAAPSTRSHSPLSRTLSCTNYTAENGLAVRKNQTKTRTPLYST